jgi:hypothetical protein
MNEPPPKIEARLVTGPEDVEMRVAALERAVACLIEAARPMMTHPARMMPLFEGTPVRFRFEVVQGALVVTWEPRP